MIPLYTDEICKHIETIRIGLSILILRGYRPKFLYLFLKNVFMKSANSADPDELLHHAAIHHGFHCSQTTWSKFILYKKGMLYKCTTEPYVLPPTAFEY